MVDDEVFIFRYQFLIEELHELLSAHRRGDLPGVADALADLAYVVLGTSHYYGVPFDAVFEEIHRANLTKERSGGEQDPRSKRSSGLDVVKPRWWTPPDVGGVLRRYGWTG
jgi:predicted HAD superfamily Cof-like phosphohydrolase